MNKKDNYKSLIRHRKQIQQIEAAIEKMRAEADARIAAKQAELDALRQVTQEEEQAEIMMLVQLHKFSLEDMQQAIEGQPVMAVPAPAPVTPAQNTTTEDNEEDTPDEDEDERP